MSLINDALKRARQVQQETPPVAGPEPEFRPVDPEQADPVSRKLAAPAVLAGVAILAVVLLWQAIRGTPSTEPAPTVVSARTPVRQPASPPPVPERVDPDLVAAVEEVSPTVPPAQIPSAPRPAETTPTPTATTKTFRLQAVVYHPQRPSAMVDGQTVFTGDRFADYRVARITRNSVTLTSDAGDVTLKLP